MRSDPPERRVVRTMFNVGVKSEGTGFTVTVESTSGYKRAFESYEPKVGPWGPSADAINEARAKATADAEDWVKKFRAAGIAAELMGYVS